MHLLRLLFLSLHSMLDLDVLLDGDLVFLELEVFKLVGLQESRLLLPEDVELLVQVVHHAQVVLEARLCLDEVKEAHTFDALQFVGLVESGQLKDLADEGLRLWVA